MLKRWLMDLPEPLLSMDIQEEFGALFMAPLSPQSTDVQAAVQALFQQVRGEGREGSCTGITIAPSRVRWKSLLLHSCLRAGAGGAETFFALHLSFCRCTAHRLLLAVSSLLCLPASLCRWMLCPSAPCALCCSSCSSTCSASPTLSCSCARWPISSPPSCCPMWRIKVGQPATCSTI